MVKYSTSCTVTAFLIKVKFRNEKKFTILCWCLFLWYFHIKIGIKCVNWRYNRSIGWSPKIPKRPNFRFSPDVWVVPNEKIWALDQKKERGGGAPLSIFFWKTYSKTYLIIVDFDRCRTIRCMVNIVYEVNILALHNYI